MPVVVTQLIVDASGAKTGVAEFEAAMAKAKTAAVDSGAATAISFERAQQRWTQSLGASDPVIRAQIAMERDLARQRIVNTDSVRLGIATQDAASAQLDKVRQKHEALIDVIKKNNAADREWQSIMVANNPVYAARTKAAQEIALVTRVANDAVEKKQTTEREAASVIALVTKQQEANVLAVRNAAGQLSLGERAMSGFTKATSGVNGQLIAMSAGLGPAGVLLGAFGPAGIAAAVAIGFVSAAIHHVVEESLRMGDKAVELRLFADATGLTIDQIKALRQAGAGFGIAGDAITTSIERLTSNLTAARRASGDLFDDTQRVNSELAIELKSSRSTAEGIDALARAYKAAGDASLKASIARAAFGRGGISQGPILEKIADAGGIESLIRQTTLVGAATDEQNKRWATMRSEIEEMNKRAKNILAAIFTEDGLKAAHFAAEYMERSAKAAAELSRQREGLNWFQKLFSELAKQSDANIDPSVIDKLTAQLAARQRLAAGSGAQFNDKEVEGWLKLGDALRGIISPAEQATKTLKQLQDDAAADAKLSHDRIGLLGEAATIEDRYVARLKDLKSALLDNRMAQVDYNRAVATAGIDKITQMESRRLGMLGDLANAQDVEAQKQREINKLRADGIVISRTDEASLKERARLSFEYSKLPNTLQFEREQLGRSDIDAAVAGRLRGASLPIDLNSEIASIIRFNEQLRLSKELLTDFATGFAHDFKTELQNGAKAWDAFAKAGLNALNRLSDKLLDMALNKAISSLFGSFMGSFGSGGPGTLTGAEWVAAGKAHTGGIAGQLTDIGYVHPAYFDHAPRYHGGIDYAGGEMPAILKRGEEVGWPAQLARKYGGGGNAAPQVVITNHVDASGADPAAVSRLLKGLEEVNKSIEKRAVAALAQHRQREG